ncbi:small subunit rRNA synthesis-associated protein, putative [Plasmodium gallinaceum]|uniref:Small subunit rRNA synthesis-associated protein, putative n=1 Tax=Plasmodium gallinaceum TaxID=5849 RepID=A0A1J1GPB8_PLAGA|nr:small subunit rRNA synthesis-associated protein, putative [Plasmodium gallinaceum]CRG94150.1 small subunit rRNA synthesis-associated protein, putative [Plasmodium gallinaceum]
MIDSFELTRLCDYENVNSHLIKIGSFNILCDLPLDPKEILNFKKNILSSKDFDNKKNECINLSNLETYSLSKKLLLDISNIPLKIHIVLISCTECFMGLPIFCKYFDISETQIICTKPVFTFSMSAVDNLQKKEDYLPLWNEEYTHTSFNEKILKNDEYFDLKLNFKNSLHLLSYKEKVSFKQNDEIINITLYSSGYSLGSSNFLITTDLISIFIVNKSSYNIKRHPSPFDTTCLEKADFVIFTSYFSNSQKYFIKNEFNKNDENLPKEENSVNDPNQLINENNSKSVNYSNDVRKLIQKKLIVYIEKSYKDSLNKICSIVLETIKRKGCVLIPVDLHFLYFIELVELIGVIISKYLTKEEQVLIFSIISNINNVIHQADLCAEWVEESRKKKCSKMSNPQGPFSIEIMIKNNRLIVGNIMNDICKNFRYPCVCFIQDSTLRFFESSILLEKWAFSENNSIIFIDPFYDPISILYPFNIFNKKINTYYCPLLWDLNEMNIIDIMNSNTNKKCIYILPHTLQNIFKKNQEIFKDNANCKINNNNVDYERSSNENNTLERDENKNENDFVIDYYKRKFLLDIKNNIIYLYPLKKKIIYNKFMEFNKKMQPVRFSIDGSSNLEKILKKIDNFYCAKVKCNYTSSFMGDYIKESHIEQQRHEYNIEEEKKKKYIDESNIDLMFGSINVDDLINNLLDYGYNKNDITVHYPDDNKSYKEENDYLWFILIKSINSKIICYTKYDIEVFSSSVMLRQQIKQILNKLTNHL